MNELDIIRLQQQAYQLLEGATMPMEQIEDFTENLSRIVSLGLGFTIREWQLTEDQAMGLLILTIIRATEVS